MDGTETEDLLVQKERLLNAVIESSPDVIVFALDIKYRYITFNTNHRKVMKKIWGKDIAIGNSMLDVIGMESDRIRAKKNFDRALSGEDFVLYEEYGNEALSRIYWAVYYSPLFSEDGSVLGLSCFNLNLTKQRAAEEQVKRLLTEKEMILHEVHHRIKNNMNAMYSLLKLQSEITENVETKSELNSAAARIRGAMVLYEKLYQSETMLTISLKVYIDSLLEGIDNILPRNNSITVKAEIEDIILETGILSYIGMIMTELITNSYKHAFIGREKGEIRIVLKKTGDLLYIEYRDDGIGIPANVLSGEHSGFGMQLIKMITEQINASLYIVQEAGTKTLIQFPI